MDWETERRDWPHANASEFVQAGGLRWHVQRLGEGPAMVLLHGTGASTHSWAGIAPRLAKRFSLIIPDLPGHGFTTPLPRRSLSLPGMADAVAALMEKLSVEPALLVGHSAGAAILVRCCLDRTLRPDAVVSINGALLPFQGAAGLLFPPMARLLFSNPLVAHVLARRGRDEQRVARLIEGTGSTISSEGISRYARLFRSPSHVEATLGMMANWNLKGLRRDLPELDLPILLLVGENDKAVQPREAEQLRSILASAQIARLPGLGHLAHEEAPAQVEAALLAFAETALEGGPDASRDARALAGA